MVYENIPEVKLTQLLLCILICIVLIYVISDIYKKRRLLRFSRDLKIFRFYPIIGNAYHLIWENFFSLLQKLTKIHKLPFTVWIGHECHYVTDDIEDIKVILNHTEAYQKSRSYETFHILFGNSLLVEEYEEWKIDRKLFQKGFNQKLWRGFVNIFYKESCRLVEAISHRSKIKIGLFNRYSLSGFCANGTGLPDQSNDFDVTRILERTGVVFGKRIISAELFPEFIWKYTEEGKGFLKDIKNLRVFIGNLIRKKEQELLARKESQEASKDSYLMDFMLENDCKLYSNEEIIDQFVLFMLAATDTTGMTLAFTFTLLGMNPKAQEKVYEEVIETIGRENPISYSDLLNLKYTEKAIFEAMRLLPAIPVIGRKTAADIDLGNRTLPAGMNVIISFYNLHRSEKYWKDPLKYDPDRFSPEEIENRPPYAFLPFSGGPKNCIGMKYAVMAAKTAVANVIRDYQITSNYKSVEDIKLESAITLQIHYDLDCEFIPRKY